MQESCVLNVNLCCRLCTDNQCNHEKSEFGNFIREISLLKILCYHCLWGVI